MATHLSLCGPCLDNLPEPFDDFVGWVAKSSALSRSIVQFGDDSLSSVIGVLLPIVDVDLGHTTNEQFQLSFIKDIDEFLRDELVETRHESLELLRHSSGNSVLGDEAR